MASGPVIAEEFAGLGLEAVVAERRCSVFKDGRLVAKISSIPGALSPATSWEADPQELAFASGQILLARSNAEITRLATRAKSFDGLTKALARANYRVSEGEIPYLYIYNR